MQRRVLVSAALLALMASGCVIEPNPTPANTGGSGAFGAEGGDAGGDVGGDVGSGAAASAGGGDDGGGDGGGVTGSAIDGTADGNAGRGSQDTFEPPADVAAGDVESPDDAPDVGDEGDEGDEGDVPEIEELDTPEVDTEPDGGAGLLPCEETAPAIGADPGDYLWGCELPMDCEEVLLMVDGGGTTGGDVPPALANPGAAECALTALRDRKVGKIRLQTSDPIGQFTSTETVYIVDDTHALAEGSSFSDFPDKLWIKRRQLLKPAAYFDLCLELTTDLGLFECLKEWSIGCGSTALSCPAP